MPSIKCPKCSSAINFTTLPPDRKVQCESCNASFVIKAPAQAQAKKPAAQAAAPAATAFDDPFALPGPDLNGIGGMDLGIPAAGAVAPWAGGGAGGAGGGYAAPVAAAPASGGGKKQKAKKAKSSGGGKKFGLIIGIGACVFLLAAGMIAAAVMMSGGNKQTAQGDRPKIYLPPGWKPVKFKGVYGILPNAEESRKIPGNFNGQVIRSPDTDSLFVFGVMDAIAGEITEEKVGKAARSLLQGDVLPGGQINVNGYQGYRGTYSVGVFLPDRCLLEMFPLEDRFIIRGYMAHSASVANGGGDVTEVGDTQKEQEEWKNFSKALYVGPKPGMFGD